MLGLRASLGRQSVYYVLGKLVVIIAGDKHDGSRRMLKESRWPGELYSVARMKPAQ